MKVYIVLEIVPQSDFINHYGESANDYENITGVFDSYENAEKARNEFQIEANEDVDNFDCDQSVYEIREFPVY